VAGFWNMPKKWKTVKKLALKIKSKLKNSESFLIFFSYSLGNREYATKCTCLRFFFPPYWICVKFHTKKNGVVPASSRNIDILVWTWCIMHPVDPPHPVLRISHSSSLPPIKTPRTPPPPPPPLHDPPKPLAQKKRTQISSPTLQIPKIPPPSMTTIIAQKRT
jgi:hypothetical protein